MKDLMGAEEGGDDGSGAQPAAGLKPEHQQDSESPCWDIGNCRVRLLDWESCLKAMDKARCGGSKDVAGTNQGPAVAAEYVTGGRSAPGSSKTTAPSDSLVLPRQFDPSSNEAEILRRHEDLPPQDPLPPAVPPDETFPMILGNEIMVRTAETG